MWTERSISKPLLKLIDKLAEAGQLKPGYLIKTLKDGQLGLFEASLAKLGAFPVEEVHRAVISPDRPELMALALAAVGIDRSVFPTILELVRQSNDGLPGGGSEGARRAASAFGQDDDITVLTVVRSLQVVNA